MASGINGPGNFDLPDNVRTDRGENISESPQVILSTPVPLSSSTPNVGNQETQYQAQFCLNDEVVKEDVAKNPELIESHLSFADLMAHQHTGAVEPSADIRGMMTYPNIATTCMMTDAYNPSLHMDTSLNDEMEKVFEEDPRSSEPFQLKMDFSNPSMASETHIYPQQKYGEGDFSSHRRSQVHMYQPMATHLSSHDIKTIQSAQSSSMAPPEEKSTKRRRHRSSSSSGGSIGSSSSKTKKTTDHHGTKEKKKKGKKQKKNKRKSLTAKMRDRTTSIPEEDEDESDEEDSDDEKDGDIEEQDEDDSGDERGQKREGGGETESDGKDRNEMKKGNEKKGKDDDSSREQGDGNMGQCDDNLLYVEDDDGNLSSLVVDKNTAVLFTVGNEEDTKPAQAPLHGNVMVPPSEQPSSFSSLQSGSYSSSASVSEGEKKDQLPSLVDVKKAKYERKKNKKKKHYNHHHHHKKRHEGIGIQRRMSGQKLKEMEERKVPKIVIEEDGLQKDDIDEIKSHRMDDLLGVRKHLLHRPVKRRKIRTEISTRKDYDRKPHEVFVELDELVSGEWKETARWIKFEEDVEESQMWGKPRVASLSFHSLLELRKTIDKGAVMLDLERANLTEVANAVVDEMVKTGQIRAEDQGNVLRVLLSKHKHNVLETGLQYNLSRASFSSFFANQSYASRLNAASDLEGSKPLLNPDDVDVERGQNSEVRSHTESPTVHVTTGGPSSKDLKIMKKIPEGAEATAVLVGNMDNLEQPTMAFVRLAEGTNLENVVALPIPVRFLFVLLGPNKPDYNYHEIGRSISTLMADHEFRVMAYAAENRIDLLRAINEFLDDSIVLPPGQLENPDLLRNISKYQRVLAQRDKKKRRHTDEKDGPSPPPDKDPLERTKRCFGGLIADVKRRYPLYLSDITDAFNLQCIASIIFIYFAALSPVITFGGLLGEKTDNWIGASEMILGCCIGGCLFGLFSGQPLLVVGSTGPLLVFEEAVYNFCGDSNLPFLATRAWIGVWIAIICVVVVAFEGSFLVRYVTRFTQEIFSALISLIFIYETFNKLAKTYQDHPLKAEYPVETNQTEFENLYNCSFPINETNKNVTVEVAGPPLGQPNTALLSTLLMFGTFIIAYFLRQFKNSKFLRSSVRRTIGDFGVPIAIVAMLIVDLVIKDTYTQKLNVPKGISPTDPTKRGWLVNPLGPPEQPLPVWMIFAAAIPAFLVFILIFMESHITEMIISKKERKLKKGTGFHINLLVLGLLNVFLSMFGMPWVCCAAVRSITHTNSLTVMSKTQAPGEKPKIEGLKEQRVTVFVVNACLGLSILMQPVLSEIPLAVLFGIFLYMGVTSLAGVQYIDRIEMLFMPTKHYPDFSYVKAVRSLRIHLFTFIETICLVILWVVKSTPAQIAFPFALVLTIPLRFFILPRIFTSKELAELDSNDTKTSVTTSNLDEYNDAQMPD